MIAASLKRIETVNAMRASLQDFADRYDPPA